MCCASRLSCKYVIIPCFFSLLYPTFDLRDLLSRIVSEDIDKSLT
jgi:hypothetical protein